VPKASAAATTTHCSASDKADAFGPPDFTISECRCDAIYVTAAHAY
jgi:hypothetical protein